MTDFAVLLDLIEGIDGSEVSIGTHRGRSLEFELAEYQRRYARIRRLMEDQGIDALVLAQMTSVRYYTGLQSWLWTLPPLIPCVAILTRDPAGSTLVDTELERGGVRETTWISQPTLYGLSEDPIGVIHDALRARGLERATIGLELGLAQRPNLTPTDLGRIQSGLPQATFVDAGPILSAVRAIKSEAEIGRIREATRRSQIGFRAALEALRPGVTEAELTRVAARAILDAGHRLGVEPMTLIFVAGPDRYRQIVQLAVERPIESGEQVFLDGGCVCDGYRCDFIRSGVIGRLSDQAEAHYSVAVSAIEAAIEALGPGRPLGAAWQAAEDVFNVAGLASASLIPHQVGHGIGLDHWEVPLVARPDTEFGGIRAKPGMVFSIEPTLVGPDGDDEWRSGLFVVEDQLVITASGVDVLTSDLPRELYRA